MKNKLFLIIAFLSSYSYINLYSQTDTIPPATPSNVKGFCYEKHFEVEWTANTEPDLANYRIYISYGDAFKLFALPPKDKTLYTYQVPSLGVTRYFKISAIDLAGNESPLSDSVVCTSHEMTDNEFLDMVQRSTFRYFYQFGHPVSGLARERNTSGETVTSGGSGFGLMALLVGIERGFISREEGVIRILKILTFLKFSADKFHGAFSHWLNGTTGNVISFSTYDDGGDLVETAYMIQGLFTVRKYFNQQIAEEDSIRSLSTQIIDGVEWDWYRQYTTSNFLYWHWSPNYGFQINMKVQGPNEAMIVYLLGIASTTHGVPASLYSNGWASSSYYINGKTFYGYKEWVGWDYGGPLFFQQYSFLGFDPRDKKDAYCNYFSNARNITLIDRAYCIANPGGYVGYGNDCWGLTASDDPDGYRVHEPTNDNGTISPTAAISSIPFTPQESINFIKHIYRTYGLSVFGEYGFKDAFNPTKNWFASSYLAIDQGPMIVMIENYRTGLLWDLFMANAEVKPMLDAIGFVPDSTTDVNDEITPVSDFKLIGNYPNPFNPSTKISWQSPVGSHQTLKIYDVLGNEIATLVDEYKNAGSYEVEFSVAQLSRAELASGIYFYQLRAGNFIQTKKMIIIK